MSIGRFTLTHTLGPDLHVEKEGTVDRTCHIQPQTLFNVRGWSERRVLFSSW